MQRLSIALLGWAFGIGQAMIKMASLMWLWPAAGDVPTLETLAAVDILRQHVPDLKIRVVNVVDLMTLATRKRTSTRLAGQRF